MFNGTTRNFDQLSDRSRRIAAELQRRGVRHGDTVAVWLLNEPDWLAVFFACARIGAIVVAVNTRFRTTELADMIERTRPRRFSTNRNWVRWTFALLSPKPWHLFPYPLFCRL